MATRTIQMVDDIHDIIDEYANENAYDLYRDMINLYSNEYQYQGRIDDRNWARSIHEYIRDNIEYKMERIFDVDEYRLVENLRLLTGHIITMDDIRREDYCYLYRAILLGFNIYLNNLSNNTVKLVNRLNMNINRREARGRRCF